MSGSRLSSLLGDDQYTAQQFIQVVLTDDVVEGIASTAAEHVGGEKVGSSVLSKPCELLWLCSDHVLIA
jgi:hypothetical protein